MASKTLLAVAAVVLAGIGIAVAISVFSARDDATVPQRTEQSGPGVERPAGETPQVAPGNVMLLYSDERLTRSLRRLAADTAGPPDPALVAAGQAVILQRRPNQPVAVVALSATRRLQATSARAPELRGFIEYWLGRKQ